jgi:hypothetical protein
MPAKLAGCLKPLVLALDGFNLLILMMLQGLVSERPLVLSALAAFVLVLPLRAGIADLILDMVKGVSGVAESFVDVGVTGELVERLRPRVVLLAADGRRVGVVVGVLLMPAPASAPGTMSAFEFFQPVEKSRTSA